MRKYVVSALILVGSLATAQNIFTVAGIPYTHRNSVDSQPALNAPLGSVYGLLIDKITGRLIFNDELLVMRLEPDRTLLTLAGAGPFMTPGRQLTEGSGLASFLNFDVIRGMAQDAKGALYVSDAIGGRVYRIAPDGTVSIYAGGGMQPPGFQSDGGPATAALLQSPRGLAFDSKGNLDIAEVYCNCIRQVTPDGIISTLYTLPPSTTPFLLRNIEGLTIDAHDNLYFTEWTGNVVVKLVRLAGDGFAAGIIAGTGEPGFSGDGGKATAAKLNAPSGVTVDANGNVYIADTKNNRIRRVTPDGIITTIAGSDGTVNTVPASILPPPVCGISGDGGLAVAAQLCLPAQTVFDRAGDLLIADFGNHRVRMVAPDGTISTIAGNGVHDPHLFYPNTSGDGGPEIHATFSLIGGAAFDPAGNLYVSESFGSVIRKIASDGTVSTIAGTGQRGYTGDGGPAIQAELDFPGPLSVGPDGALYVISGDDRVRKITSDGIIHLVAGAGPGAGIDRSQGDGGPAVDATLNEPGGLAFDSQGDIYIADTSNARVRKIDPSGIMTTVAGPGQQGVDYYNAVAVDPQGRLYVAWTHAQPPSSFYATVNRVNSDGSLTRVAGNGQSCVNSQGPFGADGSPALEARLCAVVGLAVDRNGLLDLSEGFYEQVLRLAADGTIHLVAGNTKATALGDGGPAVDASLFGGQGFSPGPVTFDPAGNLYFPEPGVNLIRKVTSEQYSPLISPDHIDAAGTAPQSWTVNVTANFAEPFPYAVHVTTDDGHSWLTANRVTGQTGEAITLTVNPAGLASGSYRGTVAVNIAVPPGVGTKEVDLPVSLVVP